MGTQGRINMGRGWHTRVDLESWSTWVRNIKLCQERQILVIYEPYFSWKKNPFFQLICEKNKIFSIHFSNKLVVSTSEKNE